VLNNIVGGGLVPTPVAGKVILDNGQRVPFCIGCGGENSAIGGSEVTSGITWSQPKSRVYWKIDK
jgi:type IV pilus assembly protein PilY1